MAPSARPRNVFVAFAIYTNRNNHVTPAELYPVNVDDQQIDIVEPPLTQCSQCLLARLDELAAHT